MLTFATPLANALAESNTGWMRLCSAFGVQWVQSPGNHVVNNVHTNGADCVCLSFGLNVQHAAPPVNPSTVGAFQVTDYESVQLLAIFNKQQPRSPPSLVA